MLKAYHLTRGSVGADTVSDNVWERATKCPEGKKESARDLVLDKRDPLM